MSEIRIGGYTSADHQDVVRFQEHLWAGGIAGNAAYLEWKYAHSPYLDHRYITLARAHGELVGMIGVFGSIWETPARERLILPCLADTVVAPALRGGPLFLQMLDAVERRIREAGVPWLLDFGDQKAAPAMLMKGWRAVGPWTVGRVRRDGELASGKLWREAAHGRWCGARTMVPMRAADRPSVASMARFVELHVEPRKAVRHVRDETYLSWRFQNPLARYYFLTAGDAGEQGFLVAHRSRVDRDDGPTPTTIMDCEATSHDVWCDLIDLARITLPGTELLIWQRDHDAARLTALQELGFACDAPTGRPTRDWHLPQLLVRDTGAGEAPSGFGDLRDPSRWDLRAVCGRSWR